MATNQPIVASDINTRYLAGGTWRARRNTRKPSSETGPKRETKRKRLGNSKQRGLYKSAHGHKSNEYGALCVRADILNKRTV